MVVQWVLRTLPDGAVERSPEEPQLLDGHIEFLEVKWFNDIGICAKVAEARIKLVHFSFSSAPPVVIYRRAVFASESLDYQIYDAVNRRSVLKDLPAASVNEVIRSVFGPGETVKEFSYAIVIPPEQVKPSGRYTDVLKITVYHGTPDQFCRERFSDDHHFHSRGAGDGIGSCEFRRAI